MKTAQYEDSFSRSDRAAESESQSVQRSDSKSGSITIPLASKIGIGLSGSSESSSGSSSSTSWEKENAYSETKTKWGTKPFQNNLDSDGWSVKSNAASEKARRYRLEKKGKTNETSIIEPNAGYVRAALYIQNQSVNLPVKLRNILCTLMFESKTGDLIPVQSFRLRNNDFSIFEVEVYGDNEFGPYVVELDNLNTAEIEKAIELGYNPKIFIVDYEMRHVEDSNYRSRLLNFKGENLKVIEENAKGRTSLIKLYGPGIREIFRVAAFSTDEETDSCRVSRSAIRTEGRATPGVTLEKALERIECAGIEVSFQNYIIDLSEDFPDIKQPLIFTRGISSVGGVPTRMPCEMVTKTGSDGVERTACRVKKFSEIEDERARAQFGAWAVFSNGRYYNPSAYVTNEGSSVYFDGANTDPAKRVHVLTGVQSTMWAGDHVDVVYLSRQDLQDTSASFGTNPFETGEVLPFNTHWDISELGDNPFHPLVKSRLLGEAGLGEELELTIKLNKNSYLNPTFQNTSSVGSRNTYGNFMYDPQEQQIGEDRVSFDIDEVVTFELSVGLGGERTNWWDVVHTDPNGNPLESCGRSWNFIKQEFKICVQLPSSLPDFSSDGFLEVYLRPKLLNAYRDAIWPQNYNKVNQFSARLKTTFSQGDSALTVTSAVGVLEDDDEIKIVEINQASPFYAASASYLSSASYTVSNVSCMGGECSFNLSPALGENYTDSRYAEKYLVIVEGDLTDSEVHLAVDENFFSEWNEGFPQGYGSLLASDTNVDCASDFDFSDCLGHSPSDIVSNWLGAGAFENNWADASRHSNFLNMNFSPLVTESTNASLSLVTSVENSMETLLSTLNSEQQPQQHRPKTALGDTRGIIVWESGQNVQGAVVNSQTGNVVISEFTVNTTTNQNIRNLEVIVSGDKAMVFWGSHNGANWDVRYRHIDLNGNFPLMDNDQVAVSNYAEYKLTASNGRALLVWKRVNAITTTMPTIVTGDALYPRPSIVGMVSLVTRPFKKNSPYMPPS